MPLMRRRPLLRAAAVGGTAYMVGKNRAQRDQEQAAYEQAQYEQQAAPRVPAQPTGVADQLAQLSALRDQGALTDDEFAKAKDRLLHG
jgi:hypothetical protein